MNKQAQPQKKIYAVVQNCKDIVKSFKVQGLDPDSIVFSAFFYRNGKKLNCIEGAGTTCMSEMLRRYDKSEDPDKIRIEFRKAKTNVMVWNKEFKMSDSMEETAGFQGLGEAEVNAIVQERLGNYQRQKENEEMRQELEEALVRNEELEGELEESLAQLQAKKEMEYYAGLIGMAMPGLAKVLGQSPAGQTLGFLSGMGDEPQQLEKLPVTDNRTACLELIDEYLQGLDSKSLNLLYLVLCEFNSDSGLIPETLKYLSQKKEVTP